MKKKRLYIFIPILIFSIIFSLALECLVGPSGVPHPLSMFSYQQKEEEYEALLERQVTEGFESQEMEFAHMESLERKWKEKKEKFTKNIKKDLAQSAQIEVLPSAEEQDELEQSTYYGNIEDLGIILIVDFPADTVRGSISLDDGLWWINAPIISGSIEKKEKEGNIAIVANFDGMVGYYETGESGPYYGDIIGKISKDMWTFEGTLVLKAFDGGSYDFVAHSK